MISYRITKYNPKYRDANGAYMHNEWTSYTDVGSIYGEKILTIGDYVAIENAYIYAIERFARFLNIDHFLLTDLERYSKPNKDDVSNISCSLIKVYEDIHNNSDIDICTSLCIARLCLREYIWCKLKSDKMFVHFGYDYYMYIGISKSADTLIEDIESEGLFVEKITSPYHS